MDARDRSLSPEDKPLLLILIKRTAIFLLVICALSLFYWIVGSLSSFLDETQSMLLDIMRICSLGIIVASGLGALSSIVSAIVRRRRLRAMAMAIVGYALAASIGSAFLVLAQSVSILSRGLR